VITERDTCRKYVLPKLQAAGWEDDPHSLAEEKTFTDGRIVVAGGVARRRRRKRADYLLRYTRDFMIAVIEAKAAYKKAQDGLQQAKEYAEILDLKFAYATNGKSIVEYDFLTGLETEIDDFPTPDSLLARLELAGAVDADTFEDLVTPFHLFPGFEPRYYQEIAVNRTVAALLAGTERNLLTLATGTGKTLVAFQICWKLWMAGWNREMAPGRKPRILYLADRNILIDDPKDKTFAPFGDARAKIANGVVVKSREIYFAIYQALARDERRPGLYREYDRDFFDLIIVDEAHRGGAADDSSWREILEYFSPAYQLGMTATPQRRENRDTYLYFGNPLYTYSLRQGIEDGFLAPYRVRRTVLDIDATGYRPEPGEIDRYGREIPDGMYSTEDFERIVALRKRTEAIARRLTNFLEDTDRFAKTIVFCVNQEHASEMRAALNNLNADLTKDHPNYVVRITADEGEIGRGLLSQFQEVDSLTPVIATTSQLLTTGVDVPTCRNIVIARVVNSMTDFKQMLGRGTRVREDYGKHYFNVLDFTGSATKLFADPDFDGEPTLVTEEEIDAAGEVTVETVIEVEETGADEEPTGQDSIADDDEGEPTKYYVDGGEFQVAAEAVYELGPDGERRSVVAYPDYAAKQIRASFADEAELRGAWRSPADRERLLETLAEVGVDIDQLQEACAKPDADPLDLLVHQAFGGTLRSRRERADAALGELDAAEPGLSDQARAVLAEILEKYAEHGILQFELPDVLQVPPLDQRGNVGEIAALFGGPAPLREAVIRLQALVYPESS
jgi:type I restriction enzyme, R subunit